MSEESTSKKKPRKAADNNPSPNEIWDALGGVVDRLNKDIVATCKSMGLEHDKEIWSFRGRLANQLFLKHYSVAVSSVGDDEAKEQGDGK